MFLLIYLCYWIRSGKSLFLLNMVLLLWMNHFLLSRIQNIPYDFNMYNNFDLLVNFIPCAYILIWKYGISFKLGNCGPSDVEETGISRYQNQYLLGKNIRISCYFHRTRQKVYLGPLALKVPFLALRYWMPEYVECQNNTNFTLFLFFSSHNHTISALLFLFFISILHEIYNPQQGWLLKFKTLSPTCTSGRMRREGGYAQNWSRRRRQ